MPSSAVGFEFIVFVAHKGKKRTNFQAEVVVASHVLSLFGRLVKLYRSL
jgi:hypothetical protein